MALNPDIVEDVANSNFKVVSNAVAAGMAQAGQLAMLNATSHQQELNMINKAFLAEAVLPRAGVDISEAVGVKKVAEADLARTIDELGSAIAALQMIVKAAQTTPPPTA